MSDNERLKGPLADFDIWIGNSKYSLLDICSYQQHRSGISIQDQLAIAEAACKIEDKDARELVLKALRHAQYSATTINDMKEVFKKLQDTLQRADELLAKCAAAAAKKPG